jgi:hypothetical protein
MDSIARTSQLTDQIQSDPEHAIGHALAHAVIGAEQSAPTAVDADGADPTVRQPFGGDKLAAAGIDSIPACGASGCPCPNVVALDSQGLDAIATAVTRPRAAALGSCELASTWMWEVRDNG